MENQTEKKLIKAIETLVDKSSEVKHDYEALKYSQSALNLAHTMSTVNDYYRNKHE